MLEDLLKLGLGRGDALKANKRYGYNAESRITENPYVLLSLRVSLATCDKIAQRLNIEDDDPRRIWAIAQDVLQKEYFEGHCYTLLHTLAAETSHRASVPIDRVKVRLRENSALKILDDKRVMPLALYESESWVIRRVQELLAQSRVTENAFEIDPRAEIELDEQQMKACDLILSAPIGVITGPPGSGKSTLLNEALRQFPGHVSLCAPTGKAAIRMQELSGRGASTIHRLLAWARGVFMNDERSPLSDDLVIVDESSMIDIQLASSLLRAVDPSRTRIIFVGDANQLPPVGPGAFFRDLIASGQVPVVKLETNHRAAEHSWVYRNAPRILAGKGVELDDCSDFEWHQLERDQAWYLKQAVTDLVRKLHAEGTPPDDIQVLSPMKVREGGTGELNKTMQAAFNPQGPSFKVGRGDYEIEIRQGDRVIQTRNNYQLGVFNGEVGEVETVAGRAGVKVRFDKQYRMYIDPEDREDLALAYAATVHKFQGSQVRDVIVVCHSAHKWMLTRQLLYTAVTRARRRVFLVGDREGVETALRTVHDAKRRTMLAERLQQKTEAA